MITRELLQKFIKGQCSQEELLLIKSYLEYGEANELNRILDEDWKQALEDGPARELDDFRKRIWVRLSDALGDKKYIGPDEPETRPVSSFFFRRWPAAAAVAVFLVAFTGWMLWGGSNGEIREVSAGLQMVKQVNKRDTPMTFSLPDGSRVVLEPRSTLSFPEKFKEGERSVQLEGQAFFDVVRDTLNPFFVKTNTLNVKVLGTSFNITSFREKPAEVSVVSGKVAVFLTERKESLILEPNERAIRLNERSRLAKMLVEEPVVVRQEALTNLFDFDETPVAGVFAALEKAYDIHIRFDPGAVKHCTLKARLDDQPLFTKLDMICASLGLQYEIAGTEILITGEGCYDQEPPFLLQEENAN